ncbi:hypothetical protein Tco_1291904 [Tanacetum coccineum]
MLQSPPVRRALSSRLKLQHLMKYDFIEECWDTSFDWSSLFQLKLQDLIGIREMYCELCSILSEEVQALYAMESDLLAMVVSTVKGPTISRPVIDSIVPTAPNKSGERHFRSNNLPRDGTILDQRDNWCCKKLQQWNMSNPTNSKVDHTSNLAYP